MDALGARRCCRSKREVIESRGSCVRNMREIDRYRRAADPRFQCLSALAFPRCPVKQDRLPDTVALTLRQGSRATSCTTCASRQVRTMRRSVTRPPRGVTDCGSTGGGIHPGSPIRATSTGGRGTASCCGRGAVSRRWACCRNAAWGPVPMRAPPFAAPRGPILGRLVECPGRCRAKRGQCRSGAALARLSGVWRVAVARAVHRVDICARNAKIGRSRRYRSRFRSGNGGEPGACGRRYRFAASSASGPAAKRSRT